MPRVGKSAARPAAKATPKKPAAKTSSRAAKAKAAAAAIKALAAESLDEALDEALDEVAEEREETDAEVTTDAALEANSASLNGKGAADSVSATSVEAEGKTEVKTAAPTTTPVEAAVNTAIDIGIASDDRQAIAAGLSRLLADTYTLYLKTHNFHWNVTGPMFQTLHLLFETQYNELALAVDLIAERIRSLGFPAPGSYSDYARLSSIPEASGVPKAKEMLQQLVAGQEAIVRTARSIFPLVDRVSDEPTADLLTQRMHLHEKNAWMLRSLLEE